MDAYKGGVQDINDDDEPCFYHLNKKGARG